MLRPCLTSLPILVTKMEKPANPLGLTGLIWLREGALDNTDNQNCDRGLMVAQPDEPVFALARPFSETYR